MTVYEVRSRLRGLRCETAVAEEVRIAQPGNDIWCLSADMLHTNHRGPIAGVAECGGEMLRRVVQLPPTVGEAVHARVVRELAGQERRTTR